MADRRYLICKGKAGLGNRLLSAASSILYARATGRTLLIDWRDKGYSQDGTNSWPKFFAQPTTFDPNDAADVAMLDEVCATQSVAPAIWHGHLDKSVDALMMHCGGDHDRDQDPKVIAKYTIDFARPSYAERVLVRWCFVDEAFLLRPHLSGALRAMSAEELIRHSLREHVVLAPHLQERVDAFRKQHFGEVTIGLHIRQSDRKLSFDRYPALADRILKKHRDAVIFLATDNQDVEAYFRKRYPRVVTTEKWYAPPGMPLHRVRECPDKNEMGAAGLVDMYLLGACDYLVYNKNTSFGLCGNLLSNAPPERRFETSPLSETAVDFLRWLRRQVKQSLPIGR